MLMVANWKAYVEDRTKAKKLFVLSKRLAHTTDNRIVLSPPAPFLGMFAVGNKSPVAFAAQDVSVTTGGAQTGEVTAQAYAASGATYAIIGHSERRAQGDTNSRVQEKLSHALAQGLIPILCIGEHERDTEGQYLAFLREELVTAMKNLSSKEQAKIIVAYEPIWAIGKTAADAMGANELGEIVLYIRKILSELFQGGNATRTLILYGGSVEPDNIRDLGSHTGINGFLVGHASVDPKKFTLLIKQLEYV